MHICHVTVMICGHAERGVVSVLTGIWVTGFRILRMSGDLVTPEYLLLNAGQSTDQRAVGRT